MTTNARAMAERLEDGMAPEEAKIADALGDELLGPANTQTQTTRFVDGVAVTTLIVAGKLVARDEDGNEYDVAIVVTRRGNTGPTDSTTGVTP